ncbi:helix-turn-helix domain-containing protein [Nocardia sp. NPDC060259]|uniref:helix-turn-helix domain-containing protein n=1 Tax=Nocardia sp. NPDC060259 TaxID=3347088 RepID=UPI00365A852A
MNRTCVTSGEDGLEITTSTAARILGVTTGTVNRWSRSGYLPYLQRGERGQGRSRWLYDRAAVERLAAERRAAFATLGKVAA